LKQYQARSSLGPQASRLPETNRASSEVMQARRLRSQGRARPINLTLSITDELAVHGSPLRLQVIAQDLVEALQAHTGRVFPFVVANLRPAPDTFDQVNIRSLFWFLIHSYLLS